LIREAYSALELRMVGGSLLIIYEADWARAEEGIKRYSEEDTEMEEDGDGVKDDGKGVEGHDEEEDDDDDDVDDDEPRPPFIVKLIDFAHTNVVPGKGPDEGVLLGMDTILRLLDGRLSELAVFS
jgi:1D-myo-inositol-tetrakisphosphate 5-kinase/inositol-polyphosphate multikinase